MEPEIIVPLDTVILDEAGLHTAPLETIRTYTALYAPMRLFERWILR